MTPPKTPPAKDLLGGELSADERELLDLYHRLHALGARDDLPPCVQLNCRQAMVMLWNACVDLGLLFEEPEAD